MAAAKLTKDSIASERRPTDPVKKYAIDFKEIVAIAVKIEKPSKFS